MFKIGEYVKNGKTKAHIEIELITNNDGKMSTFHREFERNGKEKYCIDGSSKTAKDYLKRIKDYNIQVDNLCMFLPQDRVQDFTKLNAQELLHNTQLSVCSPEINNAFESLLKKREEQKNSSKKNSDIKTQLDEARNRNELLQNQIENNKTKNKLIAKVDIFLKKKTWLEYDELNTQLQEVENDLTKFTALLQKRKQELRPLQQRHDNIAGTKNKLKQAISCAESSMSSSQAEMGNLMEATEKFESEIAKAKRDLRTAIDSIQNYKKELSDCELTLNLDIQDLADAKAALAEDDYQAKLNEFDTRLEQFRSTLEQLMNKRMTITNHIEETVLPSVRNSERKLNVLGNTQHQRIETLRTINEHAFRAYQWLQENRQNFSGHIYDPIMTEITVKDKEAAKYVENTIAMKDLISFCCTDKQDMARLLKKFRDEMNLAVNVAYVEPVTQIQFEPQCDITEYPQHLGLYSYLIDMVKGPVPIMNYLCNLYRLHEIAVGDDQTFDNAGQVPDEFRLFFSTNHRFSVQHSRYSDTKSMSSSVIKDRNILNVGIDQNTVAREQRNLEKWKREHDQKRNARNQLEASIQQQEVYVSEIREEKKRIQEKFRRVKICETKLRKQQAELNDLKKRLVDPDHERKKCRHKIDEILARMMQVEHKKIATLREYKKHFCERLLARKKHQVFDESTGNLDEQIRVSLNEIERLHTTFDRIKSSHEQTKNRCTAKEEEARKLTNGLAPDNVNFTFKAQFKKLPATIDELQNKIEEMQGRIDCIHGVPTYVLEEFEKTKSQIEKWETDIANADEYNVRLEREITELHAKWYPAIQHIVSTINHKFSEFFKKMGFVGEVEMVHKEERDYSDYGIQIRVQYRESEKLQALDRHVQSGGERAIAIAIYTLSLQHITNVPFRCVDEINQGMDPKNERKIFHMLVDITCQPGQPQYFFVTPKLLPDLPYNDLMTVSIVHNGEHILDPYVFLDD